MRSEWKLFDGGTVCSDLSRRHRAVAGHYLVAFAKV